MIFKAGCLGAGISRAGLKNVQFNSLPLREQLRVDCPLTEGGRHRWVSRRSGLSLSYQLPWGFLSFPHACPAQPVFRFLSEEVVP